MVSPCRASPTSTPPILHCCLRSPGHNEMSQHRSAAVLSLHLSVCLGNFLAEISPVVVVFVDVDISSGSLTYLYCIQSMNFCSKVRVKLVLRERRGGGVAGWGTRSQGCFPLRENDLFSYAHIEAAQLSELNSSSSSSLADSVAVPRLSECVPCQLDCLCVDIRPGPRRSLACDSPCGAKKVSAPRTFFALLPPESTLPLILKF